ncbi:hypothetical protein Fmac_016084 [Flemingia macrophylla]|uniref:Leucine-rich repeat-containing N-terminal plant-type domain-containing protein n=1 Tax=Flemingia macrophylla TaxID=520843 RepID=A0ABD1MGD3_9FABA
MESWMRWLLLCCHFLLFHFSPSHSLCHLHDGFALLQFKNSFTIYTDNPNVVCGGGYAKTTTWKNVTDCCSWPGVTCHPISSHVIGLNLSCSNLQGKIYPNSTLFRISHLQSLNLAFNNFSGSHLSSLFGGFSSLTYLNLANTNFEGEIPPQISYLSKLASLDLSYNYNLKWKEDTLKRLLQNATVLRELILDETNMSSVSTSSLNLSSSLVTLSLQNVGLRGNLTNDILCLPNLQHLHLTQLQVQLPTVSCSSDSLNILSLSSCDFQGTLPPSFSNFTHLTSVEFHDNYFNYSFPSSLLTLPSLAFLSIKYNNLSGEIPNVFPRSNKFEELHLSENNLGGELPSTLSNLQHLIVLDLSYNEFSGQIPPSLFDLTQLHHLDCAYNKLQGPLPNNIVGFQKLTWFSLGHNLLNGTIPSWCLSLPSLVNLYLPENRFTGHISAISSYSIENLILNDNKIQANIPESIFSLVNLTRLDLSANNLSGFFHFHLFSELQNLKYLDLSQNDQLSLNFESSVNYSLYNLKTLALSSMGLTEFPKLLGKVPNLESLDLSNNKLTGRVPNWLFETSSLGLLDLSQNLFTSSFDHISWGQSLSHLDLSFNALTGGIPSSICNVSFMYVLKLSHNKLTGNIPQCLVNSSGLNILDLQMNKLYGTLPNAFSAYCRFRTINLNGNQLEGLLPKSLSICTNLLVLDLGNNEIEDKFPHWLQSLPHLKVLVLRANKLHGPITDFKAENGFPSLIIFDISSNNFSGPIPKVDIFFKSMKNVFQLGYATYLVMYVSNFEGSMSYVDYVIVTTKGNNMTLTKIRDDFVSIDLSKNRFEGEIPNVIGALHALIGLNLSHNRLRGPIPKSMGNLTNLESLDLSSNMLDGEIPTELTNLNFLEVLNLSYNHLVGEIPQGKQFNTFSNDSYKGNSGLCGILLTKKCVKDPEQHLHLHRPSREIRNLDLIGNQWL